MEIKLTIVITSFNRHSFLLRIVKFLISYKLPINILILDSSEKELENDQLKNITKKTNISFKRFPSNTPLAEKIFRGLKYVNTEYGVLCAEDDFLFPNSVLKCVEFLEDNQNYSSAHGLYFNHTNYEESKLSGFNLFPLYGGKAISNEKETSLQRINHYFFSGKVHHYPFYAVHKSEVLKNIWEKTYLYANEWQLNEYFPTYLSFIFGKMKVLPIIYSSREPNYFNWVTIDKSSSLLSRGSILKASNELGKWLSKNDNILLEDSITIFIDYFNIKKKNLIESTIKSKIIREKLEKSYLTKLKNIYLFRLIVINPKKLIKKLLKTILVFLRIRKSYIMRLSTNSENYYELKKLQSTVLFNKVITSEIMKSRSKY